jgi:hypothetical protein
VDGLAGRRGPDRDHRGRDDAVPVVRRGGCIQHLPTPDAGHASRSRVGSYPFGRSESDACLTHVTGGCPCTHLERRAARPSAGLPNVEAAYPCRTAREGGSGRRAMIASARGRLRHTTLLCDRSMRWRVAFGTRADWTRAGSRWITSTRRVQPASWRASAAHLRIVAAGRCLRELVRQPTIIIYRRPDTAGLHAHAAACTRPHFRRCCVDDRQVSDSHRWTAA